MIITREVKIKINEYNFSYYEEMGYDIYCGDELIIPVELLSKGSNFKILCKCDGENCNKEKEVIYKNYLKYNNEWGYYFCRKCSENKRKNSLIQSYGCNYPIQNKEIYKKIAKKVSDRNIR